MRQLSLGSAFSKLKQEAPKKFTAGLSKGLMLRYWEVVEEEEAQKLEWAPGPGITVGHYLPAYFVLKPAESQSSTRACLVLDLSGTINQNLLRAPNLEQ